MAPPKFMTNISNKFDHLLSHEDFGQFIKLFMENYDNEFFHLTCHMSQNGKTKFLESDVQIKQHLCRNLLQTNTSPSAKICQYIHTISKAAAQYSWENIS